MSMTNDELELWEKEIAILVANAMQAGIAVWEHPTAQSLPKSERSQMMAALSATFVCKIIDVASKRFDTRSSS
jgi:hypothetical protein